MSDYRGSHQPPADGATLDDLTPMFGEDAYAHPEWYMHTGAMERFERETARVVRSVRGLPDAEVTVYRAVPHGVDAINPGDWVALSAAYCEQHAAQDDDPANDWPVISRRVRVADVRNGGNDLVEWGWFPTN